ncbi:hypothetical protein TNCV_5041631 [Trichonephila clavipes]|nr:hypothetical protein TNCV_5041631 [Trichonephila clavipes]
MLFPLVFSEKLGISGYMSAGNSGKTVLLCDDHRPCISLGLTLPPSSHIKSKSDSRSSRIVRLSSPGVGNLRHSGHIWHVVQFSVTIYTFLQINQFSSKILNWSFYASETWPLTLCGEKALGIFERKFLRCILGGIQVNGSWRRCNLELCKISRLGGVVGLSQAFST